MNNNKKIFFAFLKSILLGQKMPNTQNFAKNPKKLSFWSFLEPKTLFSSKPPHHMFNIKQITYLDLNKIK